MQPELLNEQLRLVDGTIVKKCPTVKPLYCSKDGRFFSVHNMQITDEGCIMHELTPAFGPAARVRNQNSAVSHGIAYPSMRHFGNRTCHHLIWETFVGSRTKGMEIDHINGNIRDWSLSNLEEVTPAENRKRAKILRAMRAAGNDPTNITQARLKQIFASYELMDGAEQMSREMSRHCEI
jgi:hypothetical protein